MKKRSRTYNLVLYAIYAALIFVARILDNLLTSAVLPINFAVITLSVAFACALINPSLKNGIIVGFIFGFCSFISSFIFVKPIIFGMANPLISVIPRIVVGIVVFLVFNLTYSILVKTKLKNPKFLAIVFACIAGTCTNTLLVISSISSYSG